MLTQIFRIEDFSGTVIATGQSAQAALSLMPRDGYCIDQFGQWSDRNQMRQIVASEVNYRPHLVGSYLPMSVIPAGPRRRSHQYSTRWLGDL